MNIDGLLFGVLDQAILVGGLALGCEWGACLIPRSYRSRAVTRRATAAGRYGESRRQA